MKFFFISLVGISIVLVLVPHIIYLIAKLVGWLAHWSIRYRPFGYTALALMGIWVVLAVYGNMYGRFRFEVKELCVQNSSLPEAFRDYRIVHISDLHLDGWEGHTDRLQVIVDSINAQHPDLIVFTGDIVSLHEDELTPMIPVLKNLKAQDGIVSILGNHDYMPYQRGWNSAEKVQHRQTLVDMQRNELGWQLLMNEHSIIRHGGDSIAILGTENMSVGTHPVIQRGDLKKAMAGTDGMFRILLTHDPTYWRHSVLEKTDIPLTLSGHTHGGQFEFFGLYIAAFIYKEYAGLYTEGAQQLYINLGLGGTAPMRVGATPEITLIKLSSEK